MRIQIKVWHCLVFWSFSYLSIWIFIFILCQSKKVRTSFVDHFFILYLPFITQAFKINYMLNRVYAKLKLQYHYSWYYLIFINTIDLNYWLYQERSQDRYRIIKQLDFLNKITSKVLNKQGIYETLFKRNEASVTHVTQLHTS